MSSRFFAQTLKSQAARAKAAFSNSSRSWIAPSLLTAGIVIGSSSIDQKKIQNALTSNPMAHVEPLLGVKVTQMEKHKAANGVDHNTQEDVKSGDQDHAGAQQEGQGDSTEETPAKEEAASDNEGQNEVEIDTDASTADEQEVANQELGVEDGTTALEDAGDTEAVEGQEEEAEEADDDDDEEDDDDDDDDDDDEPEPPKPLYEPVKGEDVSRKDLWDNFCIKATRMTDEEFEDEEYDEDEDNIEDIILPVAPPVEI